jgi:hypothetical protein
MPRMLLAVAALVTALLVPNTSAGAEDVGTYDQRIVGAMVLLDRSATTYPLRAVLETNRVSIQFVTMTPGVYARYSVARHVVEIDQRWSDADAATLAAVIAHEATHAQDAVNGYLASGGASACIDSEIRAFRTSALFWQELYGRAGKATPVDELERQLNLIAERQLIDPNGLEALVRQTYTAQCSH